jgi:hypothetical protein
MSILIQENDMLYFVNVPNIRIGIKHDIISKWSQIVQNIKWDDGDERQIQIPSISSYSSQTVEQHLEHILSNLNIDTVGTLRQPTQHFGITRVLGNISNLDIYLQLCLWLDITSYVEEIIHTLKYYNLAGNELESYINIYDGILRYHRNDCLDCIYNFLLSKDVVYTVTPIVKPILDQIINTLKFNEYNRYKLALKYGLHPPHIGIITGRRLYTEGIVTSVIENEIPLIEGTKQVIAHSIINKSQAIRVGRQCDPNKGLFWLYVNNKNDRSSYFGVGDLIIKDTKYNLILHNSGLMPIENLQKGITSSFYIFFQSSLEYFGDMKENLSKSMYLLIGIKNFFTRMQQISEVDNQFRTFLACKGMLTDVEVQILNESLVLQDKFKKDNMSQSTSNIKIDMQTYNKIIALFTTKIEYYSTNEMKNVEQGRHQLRCDFFNRQEQYAGLLVVAKIMKVVPQDNNNNIYIYLNCYYGQHDSRVYHTYTPVISTLSFVNIVSSLPVHTVTSYYDLQNRILMNIQADIPFYNKSSGDTFPILFQINPSLESDENITVCKYNPGIHSQDDKIFRIIDESSIANVEDVKSKSNVYTAKSKPLMLAYPSNNPLVYLTSDSVSKPYLWYQYLNIYDETTRKEMIFGITQSDNCGLEPLEGCMNV